MELRKNVVGFTVQERNKMNSEYQSHKKEREAMGIPPLPLAAEQVAELCALLQQAETENKADLLELLETRVAPGVDPAAKVKADFLAAIALQQSTSEIITPKKAVEILATMLGGYNVNYLVDFLDNSELAEYAAAALKDIVLIFDNFQAVKEKMDKGNEYAKAVITSWAEAEWFTAKPELPELLTKKVFRVDGEINTDDLSPAGHSPTRPDIPLHALSMGETRFPGGTQVIAGYRSEGYEVAFVGNTVGTGSSRKSATNSLIWAIGDDIPFVPNKRRGGVVIGESIAPIFFNTFEDSGGLPLRCDVSKIKDGELITIDTKNGVIRNQGGEELARFELSPKTLTDEYRAGGRVPLIIGRKLTAEARRALGLGESEVFIRPDEVSLAPGRGYSLAQKLVGKACGKEGVVPAETCEPAMTTVGSQDTTGPMTRDEMTELACLSFQAPLTMQSFCHTAAYPKERDLQMHKTLPEFISSRGGVALRPGDGIIHSWLNRLLLPDTVGTGGDSHTRFPLGISFPAGSGLVAFAAALGCMPLDMPESVLVKLRGEFREGITLRDVVNYIPIAAIEAGMQSKFGEGSENVFNSRILEIEGMTTELTVEQAFELSCAAAERSAAACTVELAEDKVVEYVRSNVQLMKSMVRDGYQDAQSLKQRISEAEAWLAKPELLRRDENADFAAIFELDISDIAEPALALPNNPDNVGWLSAHAGRGVDEVFVGSCMTNIGHFRAVARILEGKQIAVKRLWITPPTRMDMAQLKKEGVIAMLEAAGARIEIPGCSLCMGNQARVEDETTVFATSTRNFNNRMGAGAQVFLGSAELAAVVALTGSLPEPEEYFKTYKEVILPAKDEIYRYLDFSVMDEYK